MSTESNPPSETTTAPPDVKKELRATLDALAATPNKADPLAAMTQLMQATSFLMRCAKGELKITTETLCVLTDSEADIAVMCLFIKIAENHKAALLS